MLWVARGNGRRWVLARRCVRWTRRMLTHLSSTGVTTPAIAAVESRKLGWSGWRVQCGSAAALQGGDGGRARFCQWGVRLASRSAPGRVPATIETLLGELAQGRASPQVVDGKMAQRRQVDPCRREHDEDSPSPQGSARGSRCGPGLIKLALARPLGRGSFTEVGVIGDEATEASDRQSQSGDARVPVRYTLPRSL